jgi:hypothetical protein
MFIALRKLSIAAAALASFGAAASAHAESYDIKLQAYVPTSCSADFAEDFSALTASSFTLGRINQFCNTRFNMTLGHGTVSPAGYATLGNSVVNLGSGQTDLKRLAAPIANASEQLVIHGFDSTEADAFRSVMVVTVSPVAF